MKTWNRYSAFWATLALAGCNLVPDFQPPAVEMPEQWRQAATTDQAADIDPHWWTAFGSPVLNNLIERTLAYNNDLAAASQRVEQARAQAKIAGAELWPAIGLSGNFDSTHNDLGQTQRKTGQLSVAYEVDLWGANRAKRDAGQARLLSEVFARDALQLVLMADVAQAYFNLLAIQERKRIAGEFLQNVDNVLAIVQARFQAGAISAVDLAQQKTERASAQASLDLVIQQQLLAENTLANLLGESPQRFSVATGLLTELQVPLILPQQPSSLLQRRPDVRQIEMQLRAANADIGIALAGFYPKLQLNLDTILSNPQPAGLALAMAANLAQPLFQGGRLEGGLESARARNAELAENYQQTLLNALKEVEDAAVVRQQADLRLRALAEAVNKADEAYRIAQDQYRVGAIDFQTLLNTQRSLLTAKNNQVQAHLDLLVSLAQLYKALGGGWVASN